MAEVVKDSVIQRTQKLLGKHITKPTLTPKLLQKPPFRFLHDIVTSVIRERGFLKGVYAENELVSENIKEREAKVAFLTKLIDAVGTISGSEIDVKPSRIVAGLEPTKTNKLLQALGTALDNKLDSTDYVKGLTASSKPEKSKSKPIKKIASDRSSKVSKTDITSTRKESKANVEKKSKSSKPELNSTRKESRSKESKTSEKDPKKKLQKKVSTPKQVKDDVLDTPADKAEETKIRSNNEIEEKQEIIENVIEKDSSEPMGVEPEAKEKDTLETKEDSIEKESNLEHNEQSVSRAGTARQATPKSARIQPDLTKPDIKNIDIPAASMSNFLRPPSVRPASARPGAPRLRAESTLPTNEVIPLGNINVIVENFNKDPDEEETVVIQNVESEPEQQTVEDVLNIPQDKGHLVEQILKEINDVEDYTQAKNSRNIEDSHARDVTHREIAQLQVSVQALTKVANPLGKIMNYLHEDVDGMHVELTSWINAKKQSYAEIKKQKEQHDSSSSTLRQQLSELDENIAKLESEIAQTQASILRNDLRIKQLLTNRV